MKLNEIMIFRFFGITLIIPVNDNITLKDMIRRTIFAVVLPVLFILPARAQEGKEAQDLKREVTLYNPYKPSLSDARKKSFLPEITDTANVNPVFSYEVFSKAFTPTYSISTIKPASLLSDPLSKLYKGYIRLGLGNNNTPLAELSVTNQRSKKGAIGMYASHYSSNGKVPLENKQKVYSGFMDNDATVFGRKFFREGYLDISADFLQRSRYAYGYNTNDFYEFGKKEIKQTFYDIGADATVASQNLDSTEFSYRFGLSYDYFNNTAERSLHRVGFTGALSKLYEGFYIGGLIDIDHYRLAESLGLDPKYVMTVKPYVKRRTEQWNFSLGAGISFEQNLEPGTKVYFHPDLSLGFTIVPEYINFFALLSGKLENNDPLRVISMNPYLVPDGSLFRVPNTNHSLIISGGLKGNSGLGGNYEISASYSLVSDMLMFSNILYPDTLSVTERGNHFMVTPDDADILNLHGELSGNFSSRLSFRARADYYRYTLSAFPFAINKPDWDGMLGFSYNLRNKIIAGTEFNVIGPRKLQVFQSPTGWTTLSPVTVSKPAHFNMGLSAEYRYTRILSFWVKVNNISWERYYEWEYYPSQMFNFLLGFTYSL
jgi:hypothetical protein